MKPALAHLPPPCVPQVLRAMPGDPPGLRAVHPALQPVLRGHGEQAVCRGAAGRGASATGGRLPAGHASPGPGQSLPQVGPHVVPLADVIRLIQEGSVCLEPGLSRGLVTSHGHRRPAPGCVAKPGMQAGTKSLAPGQRRAS
ncbi:Hypothetical predicted protein [Marmota monax]|uniref:Uncharacterized protein n=1 Tax=Marmota monax TaxID=9995 RepID=A0A5E4CRU4_MARMO|nr:Hypothetical predicted protein [Marmota monax]